MRIALDAMGTDHHPSVEVHGAVQALRELSGDFTVVLVGMDLEGATVLAPFADYYALPFPLLIADEAIRTGESPFGSITQLPTSVLLGKDGAPVAAYLGVANLPELTAQIDRALAR